MIPAPHARWAAGLTPAALLLWAASTNLFNAIAGLEWGDGHMAGLGSVVTAATMAIALLPAWLVAMVAALRGAGRWLATCWRLALAWGIMAIAWWIVQLTDDWPASSAETTAVVLGPVWVVAALAGHGWIVWPRRQR